MKVVGIIAEYNPFHNGHAWQIRRAKELTGADLCVVVMSGDFVQRGAPAIFDKYTRARMALLSGADLVIEMPPIFATGSAEDFASCGVAILDRLGVVDAICFGSECGKIGPLMAAARILCEEPEPYRIALAEDLRQGYAFPKAREMALRTYLAENGSVEPVLTAADEDLAELLSSPNNILGIEYCKALLRRGSRMAPVTVPRQGSGYHDGELPAAAAAGPYATVPPCPDDRTASHSAAPTPDGRSEPRTAAPTPGDRSEPHSGPLYPSSTALRAILREHTRDGSRIRPHFAALSRSVPAPVLSLIRDAYPLEADDLSALLSQRLLALQLSGRPLIDFYDVPEDLASRIGKRTLEFSSFSDRCAALKTKRYTYTRISRALLHILLDMTAEDAAARKKHDHISYIRILGFRKNAEPLLTAIKTHQAGGGPERLPKKAVPLPMITRTADTASIREENVREEFRRDLYASHIYQAVLAAKSGRRIANEYTAGVIVLTGPDPISP